MTNVRIIKNNISGGYHGIYFQYPAGSDSTAYANSNVTIDSNTITNIGAKAIYMNQNGIYNSISYNNIVTRSSSSTTAQYGISLSKATVHNGVVGNKILLQGGGSTTGIYLEEYCSSFARKADSTKNGLVANNEIRKIKLSQDNTRTATGINVYSNSRVRITPLNVLFSVVKPITGSKSFCRFNSKLPPFK